MKTFQLLSSWPPILFRDTCKKHWSWLFN